jgi:hypothetical protein
MSKKSILHTCRKIFITADGCVLGVAALALGLKMLVCLVCWLVGYEYQP